MWKHIDHDSDIPIRQKATYEGHLPTPSCSLSSLKCLGTAQTGFPGFYFGQVEQVCAKLQSWLPLRPHQAPASMGVSKQEYWSGLPCPPAGALLDPRLKPVSHVSRIGRSALYHQRHLGTKEVGTFSGFVNVFPWILIHERYHFVVEQWFNACTVVRSENFRVSYSIMLLFGLKQSLLFL